MNTVLAHLLIAAAVTVVVGVASGGGWAYFVVGAVLSLSLWVMLFAGSYATPVKDPGNGRVSVRQYAIAAALAVVLGGTMVLVLDGPTWWAVGVIVAGGVIPASSAVAQRSSADGSA